MENQQLLGALFGKSGSGALCTGEEHLEKASGGTCCEPPVPNWEGGLPGLSFPVLTPGDSWACLVRLPGH